MHLCMYTHAHTHTHTHPHTDTHTERKRKREKEREKKMMREGFSNIARINTTHDVKEAVHPSNNCCKKAKCVSVSSLQSLGN